MAQNPRGATLGGFHTRKRPLATDNTNPHGLVDDANSIGRQTAVNNTPSTSRKRKRQQPPAGTHTLQAISNEAISPANTYINLPHKVPSQRSVPAFLHKLYNMVGDLSTDPFIRWSREGNSFLVEGHEDFARLILPRFYKHNTFASFVRQLNMYDFHKVPHLQQGVLLSTRNSPNVEIWEFSSPNFQKSRPDLLVLVTRKRNRDRQEADADPVNLGALVKEISSIKKHQTSITADLRNLHRDNEIIWQETLAAREKHHKHEQVISKILQFLTAVFSSDHDMMTNATLHNNDMKHLSNSISKCNVSKRENSNDSALGSSISGNSSGNNSGNNSGSGSGSDGDDSSPASANALQASKQAMHENTARSDHHTRLIVDRKQKNKADISIADTTTTVAPSFLFSNILPEPASRSAQAITDDIDQLQTNVETLAAQLGIDPTQFNTELLNDVGGFSEHYSDMITSASKTDKRRLFNLTDNKAPMRPKQHNNNTHQPQPPSIPDSNIKSSVANEEALFSPFIDDQLCSNGQQGFPANHHHGPSNNDFSLYFRHLFKPVDPNEQLESAPVVAIETPHAASNVHPNNNIQTDIYNTFYHNSSLVYTSNTPVDQQFHNGVARIYNTPSGNVQNNHVFVRQNRQPNNLKADNVHNDALRKDMSTTSAPTTATTTTATTPYFVTNTSIIPPQVQQMHRPSFHHQQHHHHQQQPDQFSYQQTHIPLANQLAAANVDITTNAVVESVTNGPSYIADQPNTEKLDIITVAKNRPQ